MKKITKILLGTILGTFILGTTAFAAEDIVTTDLNTVMYTNALAVMYSAPDANSVFMTADQLPIYLKFCNTNLKIQFPISNIHRTLFDYSKDVLFQIIHQNDIM